jgi:hypothetical protein
VVNCKVLLQRLAEDTDENHDPPDLSSGSRNMVEDEGGVPTTRP